MTLSFSNKRPISIAIDISAVTRYARLMDPRFSLRRTPCCPVPFTNPYPPFYLPSSLPMEDRGPCWTTHPPHSQQSIRRSSSLPLSLSLSLCSFTFTCSSLSRLANFALDSISLSLSLRFNQGKHSKRSIHAHIGHDDRIEYRFRIFDSKSRLRDVARFGWLFEGIREGRFFEIVRYRGNGGLLWIRRRKDVR